MFHRALTPDEAFIFVKSGSGRFSAAIHMLFVFFPIAVIWLDEEKRVVDKRKALPFRLCYVPARPARYFIEGHPSLLEKVEIGDEVDFAESSG